MVYKCVLFFHSTFTGSLFLHSAEVFQNFTSHTGAGAGLSTDTCEFLPAVCRLSGIVLYFPMCVFCTEGSNVSFIKINLLNIPVIVGYLDTKVIIVLRFNISFYFYIFSLNLI